MKDNLQRFDETFIPPHSNVEFSRGITHEERYNSELPTAIMARVNEIARPLRRDTRNLYVPTRVCVTDGARIMAIDVSAVLYGAHARSRQVHIVSAAPGELERSGLSSIHGRLNIIDPDGSTYRADYMEASHNGTAARIGPSYAELRSYSKEVLADDALSPQSICEGVLSLQQFHEVDILAALYGGGYEEKLVQDYIDRNYYGARLRWKGNKLVVSYGMSGSIFTSYEEILAKAQYRDRQFMLSHPEKLVVFLTLLQNQAIFVKQSPTPITKRSFAVYAQKLQAAFARMKKRN